MANFTQAQLNAIETENKTLLVSAAAGSGKTTVLIERIIRSITRTDDPVDISRLLIVTFTRAAALELKQRLSSALSKALSERPEDKRLFRQLSSLGGAHISTIDSFYSDVVRQNARLLGIPSNLRIADESDLRKLQKRAMNEAIDLGYSGELSVSAEEFALTADALGDMRNDERLFEIFFDIYQKLMGHPHALEFLRECTENYEKMGISDFFDSSYGVIIKEYVKEELHFTVRILEDALNYFSNYEAKITAPYATDLNFCRTALSLLETENYKTVREHFNSYAPLAICNPKGEQKTDEAVKFASLRSDMVRDKIRNLSAVYFGAGFSEDELSRFASASASRTRTLYALLKKFDEIYSEEKLTRGICEFNDIKLRAYKLLVASDGTPTELARSLSAEFDCIYIDEYQDVDSLQDLIFRSIAKPDGRFMVGDVKQSIYGFRGAEPSLFMGYRSSFAPLPCDGDNATVFMSDNFRCDRSVIEFTNKICAYLFRGVGGKLEYTDEDDLVFSKQVPQDYTGSKASVVLFDKQKGEWGFENAEAAYIASEIDRLIKEERKADGSPIEASDIAVLSRGSDFCNEVGTALDRYGIKHTSSSSSSFFEDPDVALTVSLLNVIDNPMRDIHLAAVLLSPIFGFNADMVVKLQSAHGESACTLYDALCEYSSNEDELGALCRDFLSTLSELRRESRSLSADKVILGVFSHFSLLSKEENGGRLLKLYENARSYEGDSFKGLYGYVKHLDEMIENNISPDSGSENEGEGVKLMTIHKSKGLEFPVCFVSHTASLFNKNDTKSTVLYSQALGIATDLVDETGFGKLKTPYRKALSRYILNASAEEEMRVLYVALTRARERLYVTADPRFGVKRELSIAEAFGKYGGTAGILDAQSYLSWMLTALYPDLESDFYKIKVMPYAEVPSLPDKADITEEKSEHKAEFDKALYTRIRAKLDYKYPYLHIANIPAKLSVSKLSPNVLDRTESEENELDGEESLDIKLPKLSAAPSFISGKENASAAQKGIATHTFLQFCDFGNAEKNGVAEELARLTEAGFMTADMASLVSIEQAENFFKSELYREISRAKRVYREQRFNILLDASKFTEDAEYAKLIEDEKLLVQGVIDIFFVSPDGTLTLCDYKTDHLTRDELKDKALVQKKLSAAHSRQLSYYNEALASIMGKAPDRVLIYSLPLGDSVEIKM